VLNIPLRVKNLVNKFDTANPYKLAKLLNIDVYEYDLPIDIRGFIVRPLRRKCILLNKSLSETEKIVVLCHEIAHARLHSGYGYYMSTNRPYYKSCKREAEANEFALHLLSHCHDIDTTVIEPMIKQKMPDPHLVHRLLNEIIL
jgi:Zn-dependent peptidase ImmA (M78 family)